METMTTKRPSAVHSQPRKLSVLLVDDHPVVRDAVIERLNREAGFTVCCQVKTAFDAQQALNRFQPDLMILELALPDRHGLEFIKDIRAQSADLRMLVFTAYEESLFAMRALRAGANGFVMKREPMERFLEALHLVAGGNYAVNSQLLAGFLHPSNQSAADGHDTTTFTRLTDRELEVFELIGKGAGTREIAAYLNRSVGTVETCRVQIKEKLQLKDCAALVCRAVGWVECRSGLTSSLDTANA
jgi:DNA-binding NarL/FixJ family response regulator